MHAAIYILLFIVSLILQLTLIPLLSIKSIIPNLLIIVSFALSMQKGKKWGVIGGFISGLLYDIFGTGMLGVSSLANSLAAFLAGYFGSDRLERSIGIVVLVFFLALFVHNILYFTILLIGSSGGFWATLFRQILPHTLYTLVFLMIFYLLFPKTFWGTAKRSL